MENLAYMDELLQNARRALEEFESCTQEQVDAYIRAICLEFQSHAEELAAETIAETGLGGYTYKVEKNTGSPNAIWYALKGKKSMGIIGYDHERKLALVAKPKGIISSIIPSTNPNITVLYNVCFSLKGKNVIIIAPHPGAKNTTIHTVRVINETLAALGAPKNLVQCIENPSIELTQLLMKNCNVILATGGANMVTAAYSSGRPAFGVGPGNVQTIFDRGYDYPSAVAQTVMSRAYDNGLICACNQSFIIPEEAEEEIIGCMRNEKAFFIDDPATVDLFRQALFTNGHTINKAVVGKTAVQVAAYAGVTVPEDTSIIVLKIDGGKIGADDPLCGEKMCPIAIELTYKDIDQAIAIAKTNLLYEGAGHSAVVFTDDEKLAEKCGLALPVSRLLVNQPGVFAANPALANGFNPTSTLGCGSWGNNSISENLTFEHLINISRIGWVKDPDQIPTPEEIWA